LLSAVLDTRRVEENQGLAAHTARPSVFQELPFIKGVPYGIDAVGAAHRIISVWAQWSPSSFRRFISRAAIEDAVDGRRADTDGRVVLVVRTWIEDTDIRRDHSMCIAFPPRPLSPPTMT
jgi:hypothetical protein